jgi:hypothetical protein
LLNFSFNSTHFTPAEELLKRILLLVEEKNFLFPQEKVSVDLQPHGGYFKLEEEKIRLLSSLKTKGTALLATYHLWSLCLLRKQRTDELFKKARFSAGPKSSCKYISKNWNDTEEEEL